MLKIFKLLLIATVSMTGSVSLSTHGKEPVYVNINTEIERWQTSKYLTGAHFVYAAESDNLYKDQRISTWMQDSQVGTIRWPGGTAVQYYHWDDLNGIPFKIDSWDPDYNSVAKSPENFMDVDEYLAYTKALNIEPMIGVNIRSGKKYDRDQDGLDEAKRLIEHVKASGYKVKFWYIGNEGYAKGFSAKKYAQYIDMYASVLKSVDPEITIIGDWKFGPIKKKRFQQAINIAKQSEHLDVLEFHEKWGNGWGLESGSSIEQWQQEFPLYNGRLAHYINDFHENMKLINKPEMQLGFNEWGLGKIKGASKFENGLISADFLIEIFRNKVSQACYWNLNMGSVDSKILNTKKDTLVELNPMANVFKLFASGMEKKLLFMESSKKQVYGFAVKDPITSDIELFLINKSNEAVDVVIGFDDSLKGKEIKVDKESYVTPGVLQQDKQVRFSAKQKKKLSLPAWSMNKLLISK